MKTIISSKSTMSADGKELTIVCQVSDQPFNSLLTTRVTHAYSNPLHQAHPRRIQSSNAAVFCEAPAGGGKTAKAAVLNEVLAEIFAALEPRTTFLPQVKKAADGTTHVISETPVTFQWQASTDNVNWKDIPGQTDGNLAPSATADGEWSRLVITNSTGSTVTKPTKKSAAK